MVAKRAITSGEMAAIEKRAEALGIPLELLMENAGASVARLVAEKFPKARRVAVFCGTGNNGGDGLVAARHLSGLGVQVLVILVGEQSKIAKREALLNWKIVGKLKRSLKVSVFRKKGMRIRADVAVDAMLGTGVQGPLREPILSAVRLINSGSWKVVAVDTPTGLGPSTGRVAGEAVRADYTVTFHRMKKGFLRERSRKYTGRVSVAGIGVPKEADNI